MPSNPWGSGPDGRRSQCPVCGARIPTGTLRVHVGSVRCLATVGRSGVVLTAAQRALVDQGAAYDRAIRGAIREGVVVQSGRKDGDQ